jgi:putative endonuclease
MERGGYVYIMTNKYHTTYYVGVTSSLFNRVQEHKDKVYYKSFTKRYNLVKLVYFETFDDIEVAITREKQIKGGSRRKKIMLIEKFNPEWKDLAGTPEELEQFD